MNYISQETLDDQTLPEFSIGDAVYKGREPLYQILNVGGEPQYVKIVKGIPFVKIKS
jgi:hypothetical protein